MTTNPLNFRTLVANSRIADRVPTTCAMIAGRRPLRARQRLGEV